VHRRAGAEASELSYFASCGAGMPAAQIAKAPRAGVLRGLLDQRLPAASTM
jgi:hypothetical protein